MANQIKQKGSTLIEGLVSLLIFSFALMGLLGFQVRMLAESGQAQTRMQASTLSSALIGMAQADMANVQCYLANGVCGNANSDENFSNWKTEVAKKLPGNIPPATALDVSRNLFTVTLQWKQKNEDTVHNYTVSTIVGE